MDNSTEYTFGALCSLLGQKKQTSIRQALSTSWGDRYVNGESDTKQNIYLYKSNNALSEKVQSYVTSINLVNIF